MRPQKTRHIDSPPPWERYLPEGGQQTAELTLGLDMYEALRLVDAEGLPQEAAAVRMGVSTPTVCRLLGEARKRVATALRDGWALRCEGGNVQVRPGGGRGHGAAWRHGHGTLPPGEAATAEAAGAAPVPSGRMERHGGADSAGQRRGHGRHGRSRHMMEEDTPC